MKDLKITIIQTELHWEDIDKNLEMFNQKLSQIDDNPDLIIFPEMFNTGFSMNSVDLAEKMNGRSMKWLKNAAGEKKCVVVSSLIIEEGGNYFNRLIWMRPDGDYESYDKRHLFRMAGEHEHFKAGEKRIIVELNGWKICPLICYDMRFPAWSRNQLAVGSGSPDISGSPLRFDWQLAKEENVEMQYDVLIYIANWPEIRRYAWKTLLLARAIENQAYVIGVNRVGKDGTGKDFSGDSAVIDANGEIISKTKPHTELIETIALSCSKLQEVRKIFPQGLDGDEFEIK